MQIVQRTLARLSDKSHSILRLGLAAACVLLAGAAILLAGAPTSPALRAAVTLTRVMVFVLLLTLLAVCRAEEKKIRP